MYAVIETGGRQYKVTPGEVIEVNRLPVEEGQMIDLGNVLLVGGDESGTLVGQPTVAGALVRAKVSGNFRSRKIIVFKYKNKTRYRRFNTHRQDLTRLVIKEIIPSPAAQSIETTETPSSGGESTESPDLTVSQGVQDGT